MSSSKIIGFMIISILEILIKMDASLKKSYIASQFRVASISYGLFVCLIGVVLNTIEPFKACNFFYSRGHSSNFNFLIIF